MNLSRTRRRRSAETRGNPTHTSKPFVVVIVFNPTKFHPAVPGAVAPLRPWRRAIKNPALGGGARQHPGRMRIVRPTHGSSKLGSPLIRGEAEKPRTERTTRKHG